MSSQSNVVHMNRSVQSAAPACAPGTTIGYSPDLIPRFLDDHKKLLGLITSIVELADLGNTRRVAAALSQFSSTLNGHLLQESIKLYIYLQRNLRNDDESKASIARFRKEMGGIAKAVLDFVDKYQSITVWTATNLQEFRADLANIGPVLVKRIESEEADLYSLYLPVEHYLVD